MLNDYFPKGMREGGKRGKGVLIVIISTYRNNAREDGLTSNGGDFGWNKSIYNKSTGDEYRREMRLSSFLSHSGHLVINHH